MRSRRILLYRYGNASGNPTPTHRLWEENASLYVACFSLFCYLASRASKPSDVIAAFVLPVSAFFSVRTLFRLLDRFLPAVSWWLRGIVRWTSWWMVHALIPLTGYALLDALGGMLCFVLRVSEAVICTAWWIILSVPFLLLVKQVIQDYAAARQRYGSIAKAGRAAARARTP